MKPKSAQTRPTPPIQKKAPAPREAAWEELSKEFHSLSEAKKAYYFELAEQRANEFERAMLASGGERAERLRLSMAIHIFIEEKRDEAAVPVMA